MIIVTLASVTLTLDNSSLAPAIPTHYNERVSTKVRRSHQRARCLTSKICRVKKSKSEFAYSVEAP